MTLSRSTDQTASPHGHYVFVDGPSIDSTLGRVIGQAPGPETRPTWRRLETFVRECWGQAPYAATFVVWAPGQPAFLHFLEMAGFGVALGERFTPGRSCADQIRARIAALNDAADPESGWQVMVGTHDPVLIGELPQLASQAEKISVFGFTEFLPDEPELEGRIDFFDIEDDAQLFRMPLTRIDSEEPHGPAPIGGADPGLSFGTVGRSQFVQPPPPRLAFPPRGEVGGAYLFVDSRNIEKELGEILGEKPNLHTRPDWGAVLDYVRALTPSDNAPRALFAHIAPGHAGFSRVLWDLGYSTRAVRRDDSQTTRHVVEEYLCGLLCARALRGDDDADAAPDVMVVGHGRALFEALNALPERGQRLCVLGFPERMPADEHYPRIERIDLELDVRAFAIELPRELGVDVDGFDPDAELSRLL